MKSFKEYLNEAEKFNHQREIHRHLPPGGIWNYMVFAIEKNFELNNVDDVKHAIKVTKKILNDTRKVHRPLGANDTEIVNRVADTLADMKKKGSLKEEVVEDLNECK